VTSRGYRAAMADPVASADALLAAAPDLNPELVKHSSEYLSTRYSEDPKQWGQQSAEVWDRFTAFLVKAGLVDKAADPDGAWTNRFLPQG